MFKSKYGRFTKKQLDEYIRAEDSMFRGDIVKALEHEQDNFITIAAHSKGVLGAVNKDAMKRIIRDNMKCFESSEYVMAHVRKKFGEHHVNCTPEQYVVSRCKVPRNEKMVSHYRFQQMRETPYYKERFKERFKKYYKECYKYYKKISKELDKQSKAGAFTGMSM